MNPLSLDVMARYWSLPEVSVNLVLFLNIFGALLLGLIVGYERTYHGRAAGMRTYGLVCMASAALVVIAGYPGYWYAGHDAAAVAGTVGGDPTRIIQGIVTGVGFLGAGVIMKEGLNISGLTTAASIWASSAIGILVGVGFYGTAILLTLLSAACMMWVSHIERLLPSHPAIAIDLTFLSGFHPQESVVRNIMRDQGYDLALGTLTIGLSPERRPQWHFVAIANGQYLGAPMHKIADCLTEMEGVDCFQLSHARN